MKKLKDWKITKAIKSSVLCIRFPFLYPRNRFDGRYHRYALSNKLAKLYDEAIQEIGISAKLESNPFEFVETIVNRDLIITLNKESRKITVSNKIETKEYNLKRLLWNSDDKFEILGFSLQNFYRPGIIIHVKTSDETDKTNYGFSFDCIKLIRNPKKLRLYKILEWIDEKILDRILCIPTYTELDAMPSGWRNRFGIDMCKDIKKSLLKNGGRKALHRYRITQIKEKFGCYDEQTEVLTLNGWKYFKDVTLRDKIATLDNGELTYVNPSDKIEYHYYGKMYRLHNRGVDLLVTPNHNLYVAKGSYINGKTNEKIKHNLELTTPDKYFRKDKRFIKGCKWVGKPISDRFKIPDYTYTNDAKSKTGKFYKRTYTISGLEVPTDKFLAFLGFYVAEGYTDHGKGKGSQISIAYNPVDEEDLVSKLISDIGFDVKSGGKCLKRIHNAPLAVWLKENCGHLAPNKKVPKFIKNLTPDKIEIFLKYLFIGDGHQAKTSNILTTTSKQLCDDVCELLIKAGYAFSYYTSQPSETKTIKGRYLAYNINWLKNTEVEVDISKAGNSKSYIEEWVDYSGNVYCLTVPTHILYVRRNGKGVWCGNSLRWYDYYDNDEIWKEIIPKYERLSGETCINCGKPATCISAGWISPYCDDCKDENRNYVPITEDDAWDKAYTSYWLKKDEE